MAVTSDKPAPYAPTSTVLEVINRYRERGLPTPINKDVLTRAGIAETLIPRVLQALQVLDLIDGEGQPTQTFEGIRKAPQGEYQQRLIEWLNAAYADALNFVDPAAADETAVRDAFRNYQPIGQQARMVSLFMGLYAAAGIGAGTGEKASATPRPQRPQRAVPPRPARPVASQQSRTPNQRRTFNETPNLPEPISGMLARLPANGWAQGERDKFIAAFTAVLDFCVPIVEAQASASDDADAA
jgi:hypothetical protein